ncbi:hypothetical protein F441_08418 [Phytophthora nicotianae CJ01A1]|uniref:Uncharacterized protein n=6 Tax=Phytophthora nicotianae TaxID=4792 RepID=W2Q8B6_PHYN3|nr:hypothetical protein PPTG_22876 [Phytophthora nicotianae INRA-310]ETI47286.1 hypothetical protein F443_08442 [Phytophthora nicotianae P1569]ETK87268.1 hypothetical protein L915_08270 [Phytophthora nicotianae]ETO76037.1 hypothetical protein F444_08496 [Phytophthora nicotianae P1976]ETP17125.1 hypothetical protein F441_08418 [Phytophthora nicotianae CJ01A1]ETP45164.1 hypothetical protein F442_08378 [Phytophthora nicotianae P10297]
MDGCNNARCIAEANLKAKTKSRIARSKILVAYPANTWSSNAMRRDYRSLNTG